MNIPGRFDAHPALAGQSFRLGPWALPLDVDQSAGLSTFWRRRMASLATARTASPRRAIGIVALAALMAWAMPTLYLSGAPAAAIDESNRYKPTAAETAAAEASADDAAGDAAREPLRVELPGGGTFELLGVGQHPSQDEPWWTAAGDPTTAPYARMRGRVTSPLEIVREIAGRFTVAAPEGSSAWWSVQGSGSSASGEGVDADGKSIDGLTSVARAFPPDAKTCTIDVHLARTPWKTLADTDGDSTFSMGTGQHTVAFAPCAVRDDVLVIVASHTVLNDQVRVIAIDKNDRPITGSRTSSTGGRGFLQTIAQFPKLARQDVKRFELQTRPIEHYEIRDVSLWPGERTAPRVVNVQLLKRVQDADNSQ